MAITKSKIELIIRDLNREGFDDWYSRYDEYDEYYYANQICGYCGELYHTHWGRRWHDCDEIYSNSLKAYERMKKIDSLLLPKNTLGELFPHVHQIQLV